MPTHRLVLSSLLLVVLVYFFFVTYGTGRFDVKEVRGEAYDSLGKSLLQLRADVDPQAITWEGFQYRGRTYMYFGPWPAMLRIPLNAFYGKWYGRWSRVSCLLASLVMLIYFMKIVVRALQRNQSIVDSDRNFLFAASFIGVAFGTPLFYLICCARIYNEACIWGLCAAVAAVYHAIRLKDREDRPGLDLVLLALFSGVALLSRATFAVPLFLLFAVLLVRMLATRPRPGFVPILIALTILAFFVLTEFWYNNQLYGNPLRTSFPLHNYPGTKQYGTFYPGRIPETAWIYFGFTSRIFNSLPPYVFMTVPQYFHQELFFGWKEPVISMTVASCFLVAAAIAGTIAMRVHKRKLDALLALCFVPQFVLILSYYFVTQRFASEFVPMMLFLLYEAFVFATPRITASYAARFVMIVLLTVSIYTTISGTLSEHFFYLSGVPANEEWSLKLRHFFFRRPQFDSWDGPIVAAGFGRPVTAQEASQGLEVNKRVHILGYEYSNTIIGFEGATIKLEIPANAQDFRSVLAIPDEARACHAASVRLVVTDESNRILFHSSDFHHDSPPQIVRVSLHEKSEFIQLKIQSIDDSKQCDWLCIADPEFLIRK